MTMIVTLVLFPAVTRLAQIGIPQNPAAFSGVHRSGVVPASPQLAVPEDAGFHLRPEATPHPADRLEDLRPTAVTTIRTTRGLRAPPAAL
jgi:hypothetical protein